MARRSTSRSRATSCAASQRRCSAWICRSGFSRTPRRKRDLQQEIERPEVSFLENNRELLISCTPVSSSSLARRLAREVALSRAHCHAGPFDVDLERVHLAVERGRCEPKRVLVMQFICDALERGRQVARRGELEVAAA